MLNKNKGEQRWIFTNRNLQQMKGWQRPASQQAFKGALSYLTAILPEYSSPLQGQIQEIFPLQGFKKQASQTTRYCHLLQLPP